jgi:hypothetical protein
VFVEETLKTENDSTEPLKAEKLNELEEWTNNESNSEILKDLQYDSANTYLHELNKAFAHNLSDAEKKQAVMR